MGYHKSLVYLNSWLGLEPFGFIEPLPGIPPNARHLADLILRMRRHNVAVVVAEPWYGTETIQSVAEKAGATHVRLPGDVGAEGIESYDDLIDTIVRRLVDAYATAQQENTNSAH